MPEPVEPPGDFRLGGRVPVPASWEDHVEGCEATPVYKLGEDEPVSYILACVDGCPSHLRMVERARELSERYGW